MAEKKDKVILMPTYIAMLRGINVSGQKLIKMETLRKSFSKLKYQDVRTYVQSGNVVFQTAKKSPLKLEKEIEAVILKDIGFSVPVIVKTSSELQKVIQNNPFLKSAEQKPPQIIHLHVTFLSKTPSKSALKSISGIQSGHDQFEYRNGKEIYLHCPTGYGKTKLTNTLFEKLLSVTATTRNWNSVNQLYQLSLSTIDL